MSDVIERLNAALEGRYRIVDELGEGGMATVYLAEDLKHDRQVALKVLKPELAAVIGGERFVAEIKTTAALQHPHILPLFDSGEADGFLFYVMPYVEGETLRERLSRETQLAVDESVAITKDVADALDYAHRQGVIHRDIKPENILLHEGRPVVADFGIAVAISAAGGGRMTETGLSLGTPHYMSPEQATADKDLTRRSDIYSLACVLYEMLAGDPPHTGPSAQAVLVRILTETPRPVSDTRASVPPHVAAVLAKALEKLPADRFESVAEFREALDRTDFTYRPIRRATDASTGALPATAPGDAASPRRGTRGTIVPWAVAVLAVLAAGVMAVWSPTPTPSVARLDLDLRGIEPLADHGVVISADGSMLAVAGTRDDEHAVYVRRLNEDDWRPVPGTEGGYYPEFSPDGQWVVFQSDDRDRLIRASTRTGGTLTLVDEDGVNPYDPHWGLDGNIVFTGPQGLHYASGQGGEVRKLSESLNARNPHLLPDGSGVLAATFDDEIHYYDLAADSSWMIIPEGEQPVYSPTGHILFVIPGSGLFAVPFDLETAEVTGPARPVLDQVATSGARRGFALASNGTLVHVKGASGGAEDRVRFLIVGFDGSTETVPIPTADMASPRFSPDGRHLAYEVEGDDAGRIFSFDLRTGEPRQNTFDGDAFNPVWSPDGSQLAYGYRTTPGEAFVRIMAKPSDNSGPARLVTDSAQFQGPSDWPEDTLLVHYVWNGEDNDLVLTSGPGLNEPNGAGADSLGTRSFLRTDWNEWEGHVSPDGSLIAIMSNETGDVEVWIRTFPDPTGKWRVSTNGGYGPRWSPDSGTLYYWRGAAGADTLFAARIERDPAVRIVRREAVYARDIVGLYSWDLHPDGNRFVITVADDEDPEAASDEPDEPPRNLIILNWFTELEGLLDDG